MPDQPTPAVTHRPLTDADITAMALRSPETREAIGPRPGWKPRPGDGGAALTSRDRQDRRGGLRWIDFLVTGGWALSFVLYGDAVAPAFTLGFPWVARLCNRRVRA